MAIDTGTGLVGTRGDRYGEMRLVNLADGQLTAEVFNTYQLNECPQDLWDALDPVAIAAEHGVAIAQVNGPRYWLMDRIEKQQVGIPRIETFGGISMFLAAVLTLDAATVGQYYVPRTVDRKAVWGFEAGRSVFELHDTEGHSYVMQALCTGVDPSLSEDTLGTLGERLSLPEGWTYTERVLDEPLTIDTTYVDATVIQDELQNTYSRWR